MPRVRRLASRTTAKASGRRSSSVVPAASRLLELGRLGGQFLVGEGLHLRLERIDRLEDRTQGLDLALILGAEDLGEEAVKPKGVDQDADADHEENEGERHDDRDAVGSK